MVGGGADSDLSLLAQAHVDAVGCQSATYSMSFGG